MKRRHKVLFITIVPSPYQRDLFGALAARGDVDLEVCYMEAASPDSPWPAVPLRDFERIMPGFWVNFLGGRWHFNASLPDCSKADFVVLSSFASWTGQFLMRCRLRQSRWLFWGERLRRQPQSWKDSARRWLLAPIEKASGIVGIGRAAAADYSRRFPATPHFCIPYHCDVAPFLAIPLRAKSNVPFTFLFCGQMIERKGVDLLLRAFDRLVAKGMNIRLMLVGREAVLPVFLATISAAARARIVYEGFQPPERLTEYFSRCDAFVLPSRHDGWGVVINQALAAGLPVISSDAVGAGLDLVEEGVNGLHFAAGDVDGLQRAMERLATSPDTSTVMGEASRRTAFEITPEAGAAKWVRVFDSLAATVEGDTKVRRPTTD